MSKRNFLKNNNKTTINKQREAKENIPRKQEQGKGEIREQ